MPSLSDLNDRLEEMNNKFPRVGGRLAISDLYDIEAEEVMPYPGAEQPGVYALIAADHEVLYIGKASFSHVVGGRLGSYFMYGENKKGTVIKREAWRQEGIRYIGVVSVKKEHSFEAAAIEEFLIHRLQPRLNKVGRLKSLLATDTVPPSAP